MEIQELIKKGSNKVRGNSSLMLIYIDLFEKTFGSKPNCAGCTFSRDWKKLVNNYKLGGNELITIAENKVMEKTFKYRSPRGRILTYKVGNSTVRRYDNNLTERFVIGYLTNGNSEELIERRKEFSILPLELREEKKIEKIEEIIVEKKKRGRKPKLDK